MTVNISSKTELASISNDAASKIEALKTAMTEAETILKSAQDYDGINVTGPANIVSRNLANIAIDLDTAIKNIQNYVTAINEFDVDDFDLSTLETISVAEAEQILEDVEDAQNAIETPEDKTPTTGDTGTADTTGTIITPVGTTTQQTDQSQNNKNNVTYVENTSNGGNSGSGGNSNSSGSYGGDSYRGGSSGGSNDGGSSDYNPSANIRDSVSEITGPTAVKPSGQTSSDGRTQRSAKEEIIIKPGDPNVDISRYKNNEASGFKVTAGNLAYELCEEDIELLCAIVSAESDKSYDDALAVITTILNRCETSNWINSHGRDPIAQATAPNQFVVYQHGSYERYMGGNAPDTVIQAVKDALAGVRNHDYCSFRSNGTTSYSDNMISPTGNRYK